MSYKIDAIEGIGAAMREKLASADITRTTHLLEKCASAKGRKEIAGKTGLKDEQLLKWVNMADLMRVRGIGEEYSELLEASGVDTVKELRTRKADNLTAKMKEVNESKKLVRRPPNLAEVEKWIAHAKTLDALVTH